MSDGEESEESWIEPDVPVNHEEEEPVAPLEQVLEWIGFENAADRDQVQEELGDLSEFLTILPRELDGLVKTLSSRTPANTRIFIGFQTLKKLKSVIYWAKDKDRVGQAVSVTEGSDVFHSKYLFLQELAESTQRQAIRTSNKDSLESRAKAASPGKLKDELDWDIWEQGFVTMLSILEGVNGVPLVYVIREEQHEVGDVYTSFVEECIGRARLQGPEFEADARSVHQTLQSLTVGENAEHWLKDLQKKNDGRQDMAALRSHYRGAGNQSRRINQAKKLFETLHYKTERALKFSDFISKAKKMFNIYEDCNEPQPESVKLRFLWEKLDSPYLQGAIEAMRAQLGQNELAWTFVGACDHLASLIPPDGATPRAKFTASALGKGTGVATSNIMRDGKLHTGTYTKEEWWDVLSNEERKQVVAERKKSGSNHTSRRKERSKPDGHHRKIQSLEHKLKKKTKKISALQRAIKEETSSSDSDSSSDGDNAGNAFGGRAAKQRSKKKKRKKS